MKMKRNTLAMVIAAALVGVLAVGCTISQVKTSAQVAGNGVAVGWVAAKDPDTNTIVLVDSLLDSIRDNAGKVGSGSTYTEVLFPVLEGAIGDLEDRYEPLALSATITILGGIDMFFATNPEWKEKEGDAIAVVNSFILGAKGGLAMALPRDVARSLDNDAAAEFAKMREKLREVE